MRTKKKAQEEGRKSYFLIKCPQCGEELVVSFDELEKELFEPYEKEVESIVMGELDTETGKFKYIPNETKKIDKILVSSDSEKDVFKDIKCCECGHIWSMPTKEVIENRCNIDGLKRKVFELDEEETREAYEFIKEHRHKEEFRAQNKFGFTTLGQQFTYHITPGGLGNTVTIECNYCHEIKDITNIENW